MEKSKQIATLAVSAAIAVGLSTSPGANAAAGMEKCYGVAKTGKNDCGNKKHSCQGQSSSDGDKSEWIYLPKGSCSKIVGGETKS